MLFMVIEHFNNPDVASAVYVRFREQGRMLPKELKYINSWTEANFGRCFQLMECDDPRVLAEWTTHWDDLVDFEIVPVISSAEAAAAMASKSDEHGG